MKWLLRGLCLAPVVLLWGGWPSILLFSSGALYGLLRDR